MCTLLGGIVKLSRKLSGMMDEILSMIKLRGQDAFGGVVVNVARREVAGAKVVEDNHKEFVEYMQRLLRYLSTDRGWSGDRIVALQMVARAIPASEVATGGAVNLGRDTQPFMNDRFVVSHNGIIANDKELRERFNIQVDSRVDTAVLPDVIKEIGVGVWLFEVLKGSYALAIYDALQSRLHLLTNFMPLYWYMSYDGKVVLYASDPEILKPFALKYEGEKFLGKNIFAVEPYSIVTFKVNGKKIVLEKEEKAENKLDPRAVVVICSGGLDSVTTARLYQVLGFKVTLIHFRYAQRAETVESWAVRQVAERFGLPLVELPVAELFDYTVPSVLRGMMADKERLWDMESTFSYVGARNLIFAALTMGVAEKLNAGRVAMGLNLDDSVYPDNNVTFLRALESVSKFALDWNKWCFVRAPFVHLTKKEIIKLGFYVGTPFDLHVSCYYPEMQDGKIIYCGSCGCCGLREYSWRALRVIDPIQYKGGKSWEGCVPFEESPWYEVWKRASKPEYRVELEELPFADRLYL